MKVEWGCNPVCWWLSLYFCFVCSSDEGSCTGCYWWLGDVESCIQEVYFVWVFTIWYSLESVLWYSRVLESVLPLQRLWAWSHKGCFLILATWLSESAVALLCIAFILRPRKMKQHPWHPGLGLRKKRTKWNPNSFVKLLSRNIHVLLGLIFHWPKQAQTQSYGEL